MHLNLEPISVSVYAKGTSLQPKVSRGKWVVILLFVMRLSDLSNLPPLYEIAYFHF